MSPTSKSNWAPPEHFAEAKETNPKVHSIFNAGRLAEDAEDLELWLVRVPDDLSAEDLDGVQFPLITKEMEKEGALMQIKEKTYRVHRVGPDGITEHGGCEMRSMHCLVPAKDDQCGKMVLAPEPFAHHITLTHDVTIPSSAPLAEQIRQEVIRKRPHPDHLKMQFPLSRAASTINTGHNEDVEMVDAVSPTSKRKEKRHKKSHKPDGESSATKKDKKAKKQKKEKK